MLTGLAGGLTSLLVARLLLGLGEGATFPAATAAMSRWVAAKDRGFAQGITHSAAHTGARDDVHPHHWVVECTPRGAARSREAVPS